MSTQQVSVGIEIDGQILLAGVLLVDRSNDPKIDKSVGRFRYAASYLKNPKCVTLDPVTMPLTTAEFRFAKFGGLPGALRDSAPDNWGRSLIERIFRCAGHQGVIAEVDYLLASPSDRGGNLHFSSKVPPVWGDKQLTSEGSHLLHTLQTYVVEVLRTPPSAGVQKPMPELLALLTGSGGARPKVNIKSSQGTFLVKLALPATDVCSVAKVEAGSLALARECGIEAVDTRIREAGQNDMVAVRRFDRDATVRRMQTVSAMTVLGADDNDHSNWSYPLLAHELDRWSADPAADKLQLFRCMVFRAMVSDRDDHPRNYSLIRVGEKPGSTFRQWRLSPMYDCVSGIGRGELADALAMRIGRQGMKISKTNILSECSAFGLTREAAENEINQIELKVLQRWNPVMRATGMSERDLQLVARAVAPLHERENVGLTAQLLDRFKLAEIGAEAAVGVEVEWPEVLDAQRPRGG